MPQNVIPFGTPTNLRRKGEEAETLGAFLRQIFGWGNSHYETRAYSDIDRGRGLCKSRNSESPPPLIQILKMGQAKSMRRCAKNVDW